ncbi:MAG TPA: polysaccharide biosynthesis tyrosine autokinase [Candidatus Nanoarchaeia archaeon]|nr:polysaccharide biosynthesis tyrosine autokinase [Candidatus Nanoarchaeia archaeon]
MNSKLTEATHVLPERGWAPVVNDREDLSFLEFVRVIRRRKTIVLATLLITLAAVALVSALMPRRYEAVARLALNFENSNALGLEEYGLLSGGLDSSAKIETQVRILQSDKMTWEVIRQLRLDQKDEFAGRDATPEGTAIEAVTPELKAKVLARFHERLKVQSVPKTQIVEIRFRSTSPQLAADIANTLAESYIEGNFRSKVAATVQASTWLAGQLEDLKRKVEQSQERLISYQREHGMLGTDETHNTVMATLDQISKELTTVESDRIVREARHRIAASGNPELVAAVSPNSVIQVLRLQEAELRNQYAQMTAKFGPSYPRVLQLRQQLTQIDTAIAAEVQNIGKRLENEYSAAVSSESMLRKALDRQKAEAYKLNESAVQYAILKREVEAGRDLYEGLVKKLNEAGVVAGLRSTNVVVIDPASVPVETAEPKVVMNLVLALLGGLLGGVALAFVADTMDSTVRTPDEVEAISTLAPFGTVPTFTVQKSKSLPESIRKLPLTVTQPRSSFSESFRSLRTSMLLASPGAPPRVIMVTSSLPSEGKSTVAVNCATVLAQHGRRVLLIDGDLRRPTVHKQLGIDDETGGLSGCLAGSHTADEAVVSIPTLHLDVLPCGKMPPNPSDLLGSDQMRALLSEWETRYDHILIDTPPLLAVADARILVTMTDMVLLVVRSGMTTRNSLKRASELLRTAGVRIAGTVVNALNADSAEFHEYYGTYGSDYGRGYYHESEV